MTAAKDQTNPTSATAPRPRTGSGDGYQVLARRYRSRSFEEVVGQEPIARTLRNAIERGRTAHAYLFCGTRGVGKTSMARIFARALNSSKEQTEQEAVEAAILRGDDIDVIEIDGASNRGVNEARELIANAGLLPARSPYKIYIIDEVHMLTTEAFNALLKTMEEPPPHVKFILCTTEPQKVPATIQSRCQRFDFRAIPTMRIAEHLDAVLAQEGIAADAGVTEQVARLANGSMRDALSLLDRLTAGCDGTLATALLEELLGLPDESLFARAIAAIVARRPADLLVAADELLRNGVGPDRLLETLAERLRRLLVARVCGGDSPLIDAPSEARTIAAEQADAFDEASLVHAIALCDGASRQVRASGASRALLDAALVRLCLIEQFADAASILREGDGAKKKSTGDDRGRPARLTSSSAPAASGAAAPVPAPAAAPAPASEKREKAVPSERATRARAESSPAGVDPPASTPAPAAPPVTAARAPLDDASLPEIWAAISDAASGSPRDDAIVSELDATGVVRDVVQLSVRDPYAPQAAWLTSNTERVGEILTRLAGRPIRCAIHADAGDSGPRHTGGRDVPEEVREHPLVREAMELFDALVVDVTLRRSDPAD